MSPEPQAALEAYLSHRTLDTYLHLRGAVADHAAYHPDDGAMERVADLMSRKDHQGAITAVRGMMPNWLTNPGAHQALAYALHKEGDVRTARRETFVAEALMDGLLGTGDGTRAHPWKVLRTEDEYDILLHLERQPTSHALLEVDGRGVDVVTCTGDVTLHFDVSAVLKRLKELGIQAQPRDLGP